MNEELTRTSDLRVRLSSVLDKKLILPTSERDLDTLIGIKISLIKYRDCRISHQNAVEDILGKFSSKEFSVSESGRLRLKHIIIPRLEDTSLGWDSASRQVSFWSAVELFNADLLYLLSDELAEHLPSYSLASRNEILREVGRTRLHRRFGRGSKFSYEQYQRLVNVTEEGWMEHLNANDRVVPEPVYELDKQPWLEEGFAENASVR
jgi:hypothetical protein